MTAPGNHVVKTGLLLTGVVLAAIAAAPATAGAQINLEDDRYEPPRRVGSPDFFAFELRLGTYEPNLETSAFDDVFGGDTGPMVGFELDYLPLRIPYVGRLGVGFSFGWIRYDGNAVDASNNPTDENARLTLFPLSGLAVLRIDVLAREVGVPLILTGKIGADGVVWNSETGGSTDARNISWGLRWAGQVALELDFFDQRSARRLDEEWGINHTFVYFEAYGSTASTTLEVGTDFAWAAGLGLSF